MVALANLTSGTVVGLEALCTFCLCIRVGVETSITNAGSCMTGNLALGVDPTSDSIATYIRAYTILTSLCVLAIRVGSAAAFVIDACLSSSAMRVLST